MKPAKISWERSRKLGTFPLDDVDTCPILL